MQVQKYTYKLVEYSIVCICAAAGVYVCVCACVCVCSVICLCVCVCVRVHVCGSELGSCCSGQDHDVRVVARRPVSRRFLAASCGCHSVPAAVFAFRCCGPSSSVEYMPLLGPLVLLLGSGRLCCGAVVAAMLRLWLHVVIWLHRPGA